jgi:uncharacterized membrane protein YjjP (DUF1212 family)
VLSNGIIAAGDGYARSKFIPIRGASLDKVVAVNQLSREVEAGQCTLEQIEERLQQIRAMKPKRAWEQIVASGVGSAAFCILFGGGFADCLASFIAGLLLWVFVLFIGSKHLSRIVNTVTGGLLSSIICFSLYRMGLGSHLSNMIIGAIIPLIPGVAFTNGIRDMANEDYLAGTTRLLDAMLSFFCISLGVALAFMLDENLFGSFLKLDPLIADPQTSSFLVQLIAAFLGTMAFAVLFGVPRNFYFDAGFCGMMGWLLYLILTRYSAFSAVEVMFCATALVTLIALLQSVGRKCPITVFLISGIFPLVPGAGIFWTSYNIVSNQLPEALNTGFAALKATVAIAFGILVVMELNGKGRIGKWIKRGNAIK